MSEDLSVKLALTSAMDKDSDPRYVNKGNYRDAQNIQSIADKGGSGGSKAPTYGNELAFSLGSVSAQNKRYRITVDGDASKSHKIRFLSTKRDVNILTGTGSLGEVEFDGTITSLQAAFTTAVAASGVAWVDSTSGNSFEVEMITYPYYQWYLESSGDDVEIVCVQEAIPTDLAGPLKDIGSYDLLGDLFVFSTTQDNVPTELSVEIIGVGPVSSGQLVGPLTSLVFNGDHGLSAGQWINITGSNASWLSGLFVVQNVTSSVGIEIVTDTAWGQTHPTFVVGEEVVTINPFGIGEIGVGVKDINTDNWTYTRLLRSVELNFVSRKAIRIDGRVKGKRKILYYTDEYNKPRNIVYRGDFIADGALNQVNSLNPYLYDNIAFQSSLLNENISSIDTKINYVGQSDAGGELLSGNKYYVFRFKDGDGDTTNWSDPTRGVPVFPRSLFDDDPVTIKGGSPSSAATSKVVNLSLTGIPQGVFRAVEFGVLESDELGSLSGTIFNSYDLASDQQSLEFYHTGMENEPEDLDVGEIAAAFGSFRSVDTVGDLVIIDKRLLMGDVSYLDVSDLSEWSKTFKHELKYKAVSGLGSITEEVIGGYLDPQNVFNHPSLVIYETYRVYMDVVFNDGTVSPSFWIDDIRIDTLSSNHANPTDNRRVANGGLEHYALNDADSQTSINVPYISFSNIDMNFNLNGVPIKNLISTIKFRFAKIEKEVLASGFVIMGVSGDSTVSPVLLDGTSNIGMTMGPQAGHHCQYLDWTGSYEVAALSPVQNQNVRLNGTQYKYPNQYTAERRTAFFYSPEISMGRLSDYELTAADKLNIYYPLRRTYIRSIEDNYNQERYTPSATLVDGPPSGDKMLPSLACEMSANPTSTPSQLGLANANGINQYDIEDAQIMDSGTSAIVDGVDLDTFHKETSSNGTGKFVFEEFEIAHSKCMAIRTDNDMFPYSFPYWDAEDADHGIYYAQLFREKPNKYGDKDSTECQAFAESFGAGEIVDINSEVDVFGGSSFIVKTLVRNRFAKTDQTQDDSPSGLSIFGS
jgi:hypothetical protein